jgi:hypothetical protein
MAFLRRALNRAAMSALASGEDGVLKRRRKASCLRDLVLVVTLFSFIVGEYSCDQNAIVSTPFLMRILAHKKENCNRLRRSDER